MDIRIKHISILNFKGIRHFEADFERNFTDFRGDNATGKTSLFDAFSWCLYGKDSYGRSDSNFQIKTLDKDNNVIPRIPHEVSVTLCVDGADVLLRKCYTEEWKKRRGSAQEQFTGHIVERFWNDVPCSAREYQEKISEICPEDVFLLITNPLHFLTMPKAEQRAFLVKMAGGVTYEDIAERYPEFKKLVIEMSGKTTEEYNKELGARIKRIKAEMEGIPQRIDERKRDIPEEVDVAKVTEDIERIQTEIDSVDKQMTDTAKAFAEANKRQQELIREISSLETQLSQRESEIRAKVTRAFYDRKSKKDALTREFSLAHERLSETEKKTAHMEQQRHEMETKRLSLIEEWKKISARTMPEVSESEFVCPTCGRRLDDGDIAAKVEEMTERFNSAKAKDLTANKEVGLKTRAEIDRLAGEETACRQETERLKAEISRIENEPDYVWNDSEPDVSPYLDSDVKANTFRSHIDALKSEVSSSPEEPDQSELKARKAELLREKSAKEQLLIQQETRKRSLERIMELEEQYRQQNEEIASLEGMQYQVETFRRKMMNEVEQKINSMFTIVRFKMYEQQINGGERETCEALVDGVPFSTNLNSAARINAGIDVINAISRRNDAHAPIFIDNRESVTSIIDTESQVINLIKDETYKQLTKV